MNRFATLVFDLPERIAGSLLWLPPALARIAVGWVFLQTGWGKLQNLDRIVAFFADLGIPWPGIQAPFVSATELVCGSLVLVGLFTRFAAVPLIGTMVVAIATAQWSQVDSAAALFGLVESLYIVLFAWLAIAGPGPLSLDALLERFLRRDARPTSAVYPAVAGARR